MTARQRYKRSPKGKETEHRYATGPKGLEMYRRYNTSPRGKEREHRREQCRARKRLTPTA